LKKKRRPSVSPLTTNTEIEAHRSLERYQTRELRKKESESLEKRPVSVVISKDGEEPLSQKELYKKKIARHNERRRARGGEESPAESPEVVAKPRPKFRPFNADLFDENRYDLPNSQAPIPGREAFWDMDTPETKRFRESLLSKSPTSLTEEPQLHLDASPTLGAKLKLKPKRRLDQPPKEKAQVGESALERAMQLCREDEEEEKRRWRAGQEEEMDEGGDVNSRVENLDGRDNVDGIFNVSTEPIERDMFDDSPIIERNHVNEEVALSSSVAKQINFETLDMKEEDNDAFPDELDDGQDSFLLAASQMVEEPVLKMEVKKENVDTNIVTSDINRESKPMLPPVVARLQQMDSDGFGSDDSFDEQMSQLPPGGLGTPTSPILKKNRKSFSEASSSRSPALSTRSKSTVSSVSTKPATNISSCSFKDIKSGTPLAEAPTASTPSRPLNVGHRQDQSKQTPYSALKKYSSFDQTMPQSKGTGGNLVNPISSGGVVFKRVKSSPVVSQLRSKEEIERKRKEALAKREEAGRRRVKSEEEAERKRREEAERKNVDAKARKKEEAEKYNRVLLREAEEKKKKELIMEEEAERLRAAKEKEEAAKRLKEQIERKKREAKERLARSRSQQSQQSGVSIGSAVR